MNKTHKAQIYTVLRILVVPFSIVMIYQWQSAGTKSSPLPLGSYIWPEDSIAITQKVIAMEGDDAADFNWPSVPSDQAERVDQIKLIILIACSHWEDSKNNCQKIRKWLLELKRYDSREFINLLFKLKQKGCCPDVLQELFDTRNE